MDQLIAVGQSLPTDASKGTAQWPLIESATGAVSLAHPVEQEAVALLLDVSALRRFGAADLAIIAVDPLQPSVPHSNTGRPYYYSEVLPRVRGEHP